MIATIIFSLLAIALAWLARFPKFKFGLELAFLVLTAFMAVRYNYGNDYPGYLDRFLEIGFYTADDMSTFNTEIGWVFINRLFQSIGFFGMTIVLTIFEFWVIYKIVKKYVPVNWYWLAVFIFCFNPYHMLVFSSMMRQFLAMTIFVLAINYIVEKKWLIALLLVWVASLFHASALILLPFCFLGFANIKLKVNVAITLFALYIFLYFTAATLFKKYFLSLLLFQDFEKYGDYIDPGTAEKAGSGVVFNMIIFLLILLYQRFQDKDLKIIFLLFAVSWFFYLFGDIAPMTARLGYYFSILSIVCFPILFNTIKEKAFRGTILAAYLAVTVKGFYNFFDPAGIWYEYYKTYKTIFSVYEWY